MANLSFDDKRKTTLNPVVGVRVAIGRKIHLSFSRQPTCQAGYGFAFDPINRPYFYERVYNLQEVLSLESFSNSDRPAINEFGPY